MPETDLLSRAVALATQNHQVSASVLEQELSIGSNEAKRLLDQLDTMGLIERQAPSRVSQRLIFRRDREVEHRISLFKKCAEIILNSFQYNFQLIVNLHENGIFCDQSVTSQLNTLKISHISMANSNISALKECKKIDIHVHNLYNESIKWHIDREIEKLKSDITDSKEQFNNELPKTDSVESRLVELESFARNSGGIGVAEQALKIFPELRGVNPQQIGSSTDLVEENLPEKAPSLWSCDRVSALDSETGKDRLENAGEFTRRVYGPWLGNGMTRNLLRKLDNPLFQALYRAYGANLPDDLPLPTKKEENDRWVARVEKEGLAAVIPDGASSDFALREAQRLLSARQRRNRDKS